MKSLIPPPVLRVLTLPVIRRLAARRLRKSLDRVREMIPTELGAILEAIFVHDLIGNVDPSGGGEPDAFRFAITNCWFYQRIVKLNLRLDGKRLPPEHIHLDDGFGELTAAQLHRAHFEPGVPFIVTLPGRPLKDGLHFIDLELIGEVAPLYALSVPIRMQDGVGTIAIWDDPPDVALRVSLPPEANATMHYVPHVHFDLEWLRDRATFGKLAVGNLLEAIRNLENDPQATFVIDQTPQLEALDQVDPNAFARLKKLVDEGRVELLMGFYAEPDVNLIGGESLVRQAIAWQTYCREKFGCLSTVGWLPDSFGMCATLPQILLKAGCKGFAFSRGVHDADTPAAFMWEGLDGSRIKTHWMHEMYFAGYPLPNESRRSMYKLGRIYSKLAAKANDGHLFCPAGIDHGKPQAGLNERFNEFNRAHAPARVASSLPMHYFAALPDRGLPVVHGEFNPDNAGVYTARPELKQLHRRAETALADLERIALMTGGAVPSATLNECWEKLFASQFHDSLPGCHTDEVSKQVRYRLEWVNETAHKETARLLDGSGVRNEAALTIVNTLPFAREETVEIEVFPHNGELPRWTDGKVVFAQQIVAREHYGDGTTKRARALLSVSVPPLSWLTIRPLAADETLPDEPERAVVRLNEFTLSNAWLDVTLDPATATILRIVDRQREQTFELGGAGRLTTGKDAGTLYLANRKRHKTAEPFLPERIDLLEKGPLRAMVRFSGRVGKCPARITYSLSRASKRIDVETSIEPNRARRTFDVRVPLLPDTQAVVHEIPYGELARAGGEFAALNYVDIVGDGRGLALLNAGIPSHRQENGELVMGLLRTVDKIHFHDAGPQALSLGRLTFRYSFFPHRGDARQAHVYRRGLAFNAPLSVHRGAPPAKDSPLTLTPDSIELGALYRDADGALVVRLIERGGKDTVAELHPSFDFTSAEITDLLGRAVRELKPHRFGKAKGALSLTFRAFEIKTLRFR
ncbi:MAG TPA: hypothetical protein PKW95_01500 [bacterium]|nr:hypothetical protein [bacterium]